VLLGTHLIQTTLFLASWAFIGASALSGRTDRGRLVGWALCLASTVPLAVTSRWLEGVLAIGVGGLLKQRLLAGAMAFDVDLTRQKGVGKLLSEVFEAEAIERLGVSGGLEMILAGLELGLAVLVLTWGAAGVLEIAVLVAWGTATVILMALNIRLRQAWTDHRLALTQQTVEQMTAYRTRVAQQTPAEWHRDEDVEHERYADLSASLDRSVARIEGAVPRGYVIIALTAFMPSFLSLNVTILQQAITLGAILYASDAFRRLTLGFTSGAAAWVAWRAAKPMVDAPHGSASESAERFNEECPSPVAPCGDAERLDASRGIIKVEEVVFTHQGRIEPAVKECSVSIARGDLVLLEGDSGSGKSTFASLLAGARTPSAGLILAGGLDLATLGVARWRQLIAAVPQYHENHIVTAPLAFNLLLGRPYPHTAQDLQDARDVCKDLGLSSLVARMPGGLDQIVGETGWQLSHGERSRVFLARALLQGAELVLLDETLAALDPDTLHQCLECVMRRAPTLLVIAHP
jgi:ATP-binding cassette subfamily B protein